MTTSHPDPYRPIPSPLPAAVSYGAPVPPRAPRRRGPKVLTFVGAGVLLVGLVAGIAGVVGAARSAGGFIPTGIVAADGTRGPDALAFTEVPGTATFEVTETGGYLLYEVSSSARSQIGEADVVVTGPGGPVDAAVSGTSQTARLDDGRVLRVLGAITADQAGTYEVEVRPADVSGVAVAVGRPITDDAVAGLGAGALTALAGFGLGGLGFALLLAGVIWWAVSGSRR